MGYTSRILPAEEYWRLMDLGIPAESLPHPDTSIIGVIEEDGQIIGRWMAVNVIMFEGLKIEEAYRRRPGVARRLLNLMIGTLRAKGVIAVTTITQEQAIGDLACRAGFCRIPGTLYQKDLREGN
jgi:N-acetylglutamate synthase-like GNAT family acetyltransferase